MSPIWDMLRSPTPVVVRSMHSIPARSSAVVDVYDLNESPEKTLADDRSALILLDESTSPWLVKWVVDTLKTDVDPVIGLPPQSALRVRHAVPTERWLRFSRRLDIRVIRLGNDGWMRIDMEIAGGLLGEIFLPVEFDRHERIIAMPGARSAGPMGVLLRCAHPHTRLRTGYGNRSLRLSVEVAATLETDYVFGFSEMAVVGRKSRSVRDCRERFVVWTDDVVAGQLVWRSIQRFHDARRGIEGIGPWEDSQIQSAAEIGLGVDSGSKILVRVHSISQSACDVVNHLVIALGCRVQY